MAIRLAAAAAASAPCCCCCSMVDCLWALAMATQAVCRESRTEEEEDDACTFPIELVVLSAMVSMGRKAGAGAPKPREID